MRMRSPGRRYNLFTRGIWHAVGNVVSDGAKEQEWLLQYQTNVPAVIGHLELFDVDTIQRNAAFRQIIKTAHQVDQGTFTRAAVPHQTNHLAWLDVQIQMFDDCTIAIAKTGICQSDTPFHFGQGNRVDRFRHTRNMVQDFENSLGTGSCFLRARNNAAHAVKARVKAADVCQKCRQHAHRNLVFRNKPNSKTPHHQQTHLGHQGHRGRKQGPNAIESIVDRQIVFVGIHETLRLTIFLGKSLDHPNTWNGVSQHVGDLRPNTVNFLETCAQSFTHHMNQPADEGQGQKCDQGQGGIDGEQNDRRHHDHQNIGGKVQ